jgi:hypothetical protein
LSVRWTSQSTSTKIAHFPGKSQNFLRGFIMTRTDYSTTGHSRLEFPKIETIFGTLAYWLSLQFGEHGWTYLGGFEPPYTGVSGRARETLTVNNVEYEGSIQVFLARDNDMRLSFSSLHRVDNWRAGVTPAAIAKLERELMPVARKLFPMPTPENYANYVFESADRQAYSGASSAIHSHRVSVYRDERYKGYSDDIRAGMESGLQRAIESLKTERFETSS